MYVICLEGCHGSGKTQLVNRFREAGYTTMDEAFIDMPKYALHPQSLCMETFWVGHWFQRLLKIQHTLPENGKNTVFIADRSPFSAIFYSRRDGHHLDGVIRSMISELRDEADIHVVTVCVRTQRDLLWKRINDRLQMEPHRRQYNEQSREWMETTLDFYDNFNWDYVVENNEVTLLQVARRLLETLERNDPAMRKHHSPPKDSPLFAAIQSADDDEELDDVDTSASVNTTTTDVDTSCEARKEDEELAGLMASPIQHKSILTMGSSISPMKG